jgi:hypothetical protein
MLAAGDHLQLRAHDKKHQVANGEFATTELDRKQINWRFDDKRALALPFAHSRTGHRQRRLRWASLASRAQIPP